MICGLARCHESDIKQSWKAVKEAYRPRIHTFLATSDIHLEHKLKMTRAQVLKQVSEFVALATSLCPDVEFSTEDGCRSDRKFLVEVCHAAIEAGATTLNIPDTVGYITPHEYGELMAYLIDRLPVQTSGLAFGVCS